MEARLYNEKDLHFFPLYGIYAGHEYLQEPVERPSGLYAHQVFVVRKGMCELRIGEQIFVLKKNDMFFIPANLPHSYKGIDEYFSTSFLGFLGNGCDAIFQYYNAKTFRVYKQKNTHNFLSHLLETIELFRHPDNNPSLCASTYATIIAFFDDATKKEVTPLEKVLNYLKINFSSPISLADLLEIYPYSKSKLCQDFQSEYGMSIFEMLMNIRLNHAQSLLSITPSIKLKLVIESCGFNDMSYFCKMYKKKFGKSPKAL